MKIQLPALFLLCAFALSSCVQETEKDAQSDCLPIVECDDFPPAHENLRKLNQELSSSFDNCLKDSDKSGTLNVQVYIDAEGKLIKWVANKEIQEACVAPVEKALNQVKWTKALSDGQPTCYYIVIPINLN